jgi:hypothetical protein
MGRISKAARGKHRWIGIRSNVVYKSREDLKIVISNILGHRKWALYDFKCIDELCFFIIKARLEDYETTLNLINSDIFFKTLTSSGKINLVRERIF